ncbi:MAG: DMT family transporter [Eubacterium sp.]|nr:DMT family transporter [Eubacterium sp.]
MNRKYHLGVLYLILSAFFFALMAVFIRLAGDIPSVEKAFFRNIVAFFIAGSMLVRSGEKIHIPERAWFPIIMRAAFGSIGIFCNFYAVDHLLLSDASILNKMSPFFAVVGSYFILKEKFTFSQGLAVFIAFLGGMFVVKPSFSSMDFVPAAIGLLGGVGAGLAYSFLRKAGSLGVNSSFVVLFFSAFSCILCVPFMVINFVTPSLYQFVMLLLCGVSAAGGQFTITAAYYHAPAKEISVFDYTQLIFSTAFGYFIFSQTPDHYSIIGYLIITSMAVWMFFYNKKHSE